MLACFILGLLWICTFYVLSGNNLPKVAVFNDLDQWNLVVGIAFMAVGLLLRHALGVIPGALCSTGSSR